MNSFLLWLKANTSPMVRRVVVGGIGGSIALAGIALLVLPGPGIPLLLVGLGVLSLEFAIAETWITALKLRAQHAGVPKSAIWMLPAAGCAISLLLAILPGFYAVIHGRGTWTVVRKPSISWAYSYCSEADLRDATSLDPFAEELLSRSKFARVTTKTPANSTPDAPAP